ncbi:Hypothetical predicted protein [Cloeon dipterum]|uniref:F-box domain-containing protein n=1 Tax=Cloeon dipterum TaxID=197152 RepID=A0A8S1DEK1_9INSE|nr:Hypothetical predicted protein [Cloeon dipterum]
MDFRLQFDDYSREIHNLTLEQQRRASLESLYLNSIVEGFRPSSGNRTIDLTPLRRLSSISSREALLRKLAFANTYEPIERQIPTPWLFEILLDLLDEPILNLDFSCVGATNVVLSVCFEDMFNEAIDKLVRSSTSCIKTLKINAIQRGVLFSPETGNLRKIIGLKNLQELRLPSYIFQAREFEDVTNNLLNLSLLECNLHVSIQPEAGCEPTLTPQPERVNCLRHETRICHVLDEEDTFSLTGASKLQHLFVQRHMQPRQVQWHSKHARSLCVLNLKRDADWEPLLQLARIESLFLFGCTPSREMMVRMLERFGLSLNLFSCDSEESPPVHDILVLCPRLTSLKTMSCLPIILERLTELHFLDTIENRDRFIEVLTAPNLQRLEISFESLHERSLAGATIALRSRGDVAPKLKSLRIRSRLTTVTLKEIMVNFVRVICTKAPYLMEVKMPLPELEQIFNFINARIYFNS